MTWALPIGAQIVEGGVRFRVWAPARKKVEVVLADPVPGEPPGPAQRLTRDRVGYWTGTVPDLGAGTRYFYRLDGTLLRPDPAARFQSEGVHGPSTVVDPAFPWTDAGWRGIPLERLSLYETHIGTATPAGTFASFVERLDYLQALGVTAIEIMPVADFPGARNWGYDGVCLFAPARAYGGPRGLQRLVDAAHARGLAVILDVVYNHLGPDGNYLPDFTPRYFNPAQRTTWGQAINFGERAVRDFTIANALYWAHEYHVDGLRLDATHALVDPSPQHILSELPAAVRASLPPGRHFLFIAEDERNDVRLIRGTAGAPAPMDAVWADDFHHQVRVALAHDDDGYYASYTGRAADLAATLRQGWFYTGQPAPHTGRPRGSDAAAVDPPHFVYCIQNHDQIGNRALGDRLTATAGLPAFRAASTLLLLSPATPLIFQGQEWAASTPFLFFTDHAPALGALVTEGRRAEFAHFASFQGAAIPDPQAVATFLASKLQWAEIAEPPHTQILTLYHELFALRTHLPAFADRRRAVWESVALAGEALALRYGAFDPETELLVVVNLAGAQTLDLAAHPLTAPPPGYAWQVLLSSEDPRFGGATAPTPGAVRRIAADGPIAVALGPVARSGG